MVKMCIAKPLTTLLKRDFLTTNFPLKYNKLSVKKYICIYLTDPV